MYRLQVCREMRARASQSAFNWVTSFNPSSFWCREGVKLDSINGSLPVGKRFYSESLLGFIHSLPFATVKVEEIAGSQPAEVHNLVQGKWIGSSKWNTILDPLNGESFIKVAEIDETEIQPFVESLSKVPKHGLHNPFKAPERYLMLGDVSVKAAHMLSQPEVSDFFTRLIQRVSPKSYQQALGEVYVTRKFLENFCGDQVAIITPFNFPLEIPVLQLMGALYMGNKPVLKVDSKVCIVMEQMLRLLHDCGLPVEDVDFINSDGKTMNKLLLEGNPRMTLFTGSSRVADKLAVDLKGRIKLEDAGFDWKILGPDVEQVDYVAWVCDQDAYACSGQKCSAQSMLFMHENWSKSSLLCQMNDLAARRKLEDLTVGPVLTFTTEAMFEHMNKLLQISGSKLLFGGEALKNHSIPSIYGAIKPTAIFVPLEELLKDNNYELVTREVFGPFQIITEYKDHQLPMVLDALERMHAHLTAAIVSNDPLFLQEVIGKSVNGTTYAGLRARTTGAPQNHWFGPAGDPRGAGIGTPEAIKLVWSCHREIIYDFGPVPQNWETPAST
ncbi:delta-1-pyrroline-5-carboxylate dehydrogenase 12A1, mitochondrial-like isoform X2 [Actinidia eriantha]|uniref:delta-1-pyrroline-5-carboxylate dehydrogenase 12A1, mitochondrial-like isoform X2 n=1 Tax=Actinidia eriantha TaxID=165200 RepID=UPI002582E321|nr:delta-1-pyrroline-5-carboxylate dehydrogenase 12A1, mitochondrial-like isoform X2 [Actinidia eriantha]